MYKLERLPDDLDSADAQTLQYVSIRNGIRRVLGQWDSPPDGVMRWACALLERLPENERQELAELLPRETAK